MINQVSATIFGQVATTEIALHVCTRSRVICFDAVATLQGLQGSMAEQLGELETYLVNTLSSDTEEACLRTKRQACVLYGINSSVCRCVPGSS